MQYINLELDPVLLYTTDDKKHSFYEDVLPSERVEASGVSFLDFSFEILINERLFKSIEKIKNLSIINYINEPNAVGIYKRKTEDFYHEYINDNTGHIVIDCQFPTLEETLNIARQDYQFLSSNIKNINDLVEKNQKLLTKKLELKRKKEDK